jgi:SAM-dependent methyltransferase
MHASALKYGKDFFDNYLVPRSLSEKLSIIEIGSLDVNGSLRGFSPHGASYIGVDFVEGRGVDIVLSDPYHLPFDSNTIDAVICSSVLEHSAFFWLLFLECLRILKPDGLIYINVPSNGMVHRFPIDGWRFYPDAGKALIGWAHRSGYESVLLESFIAPKLGAINHEGMWNDFVAIFIKNEEFAQKYLNRIIDHEKNAFCGYAHDREYISRQEEITPDGILLSQYQNELQIARLQISEYQSELQIARLKIDAVFSSMSWRITIPVRWIAVRLALLFKAIKDSM